MKGFTTQGLGHGNFHYSCRETLIPFILYPCKTEDSLERILVLLISLRLNPAELLTAVL